MIQFRFADTEIKNMCKTEVKKNLWVDGLFDGISIFWK